MSFGDGLSATRLYLLRVDDETAHLEETGSADDVPLLTLVSLAVAEMAVGR